MHEVYTNLLTLAFDVQTLHRLLVDVCKDSGVELYEIQDAVFFSNPDDNETIQNYHEQIYGHVDYLPK